ncbi:conserved exported protein of unknown function [Georgfuchsia toluolica]|uniref:Outer membrane cytochrome MtrC/MtrF-like domain-containing protein n=1 Tax=Georgfuchsia toluolica TaxID=424218 RepID=A0A916J445_9PROT|nr:OmcA/MtrC family decaheme c-type cytochrome [Georgfuchsia toluolica]CAG4883520.1 conserved exported protein of unknown function [Georgfuchsia toluolica]
MKFKTLIRLGLVMLIAGTLAGCGDDGSNGSPGATGAQGPAGPAGPAGQDAVATVAVASNTATPTSASTAAWAALAPQVTVQSVTIASAPVVNFTVKDAAGNPVVGLGNKSQSATATVASLTNLGFTLAKLVPGTNGAPSKWVSYNVLRPVTVAEKAGTIAATTSCDSATAPTWCGTFPTTDAQGTLVDNGDGTYQYTFYRDPTQVATLAAALIDTANGLNKKADLGDLSFDATLTHRLGIQLGGAAPGTGSNTPTAVTVTPSVNMVNTANAVFDFRPDGGSLASTRNIVKIDSCSGCHAGKVLAHGSRKDPQYCVTCHTDQIRYSFSQEASSTDGGMTLTGTTRQTTAVVDGRALGNLPNMLHHIHMGEKLLKQGYNFNNSSEGKFNEVTYPQPVTNCVKCHDGSATAVNKTANGDNWKMVPSRLACGACHDGINFATGGGTTLNGEFAGHVGGAKADDSQCALCHGAADIPMYHVTVDPTGSNGGRGGYPLNTAVDTPTVGYAAGMGPDIALASQLNMPAGAYKIGLEIKSASVASNKATVVYRILKDDGAGGAMAPVTLNAKPACATTVPATCTYQDKDYLINNLAGSPSIYVVYAAATDGVASPADWTGSISASVSDLRDGIASKGTQTGPDVDGYYTATLATALPAGAKLVTAALGVNYNGFVQLNLADYPKGLRLRETQFAIKTATGYTARRSVVSNAKCNNCHGQLGVDPSFHSGSRNNGEGCPICHTANTPAGHGATGWSLQAKNMIHSIHGASKRTQDFTYQATAENPKGFGDVTYPGVLKKCETCHVPGSYDFGATANAAAVPNLLWATDTNAVTHTAGSLDLSPWVTTNGAGPGDYSTDNLVSSPIASACFGCHDSSLAVSHMESNGGTIVRRASTVTVTGTGVRTSGFAKAEQCTLCHASGKLADIKTMHAQ